MATWERGGKMHPASLRRQGGGQPQQTAAVRQTRKLPRPEARRLAATPLASSFTVVRVVNPNYFVFYKFLILLLSAGLGRTEAMAAAKTPRGARDAGTCGLALQPHAGPDSGSTPCLTHGAVCVRACEQVMAASWTRWSKTSSAPAPRQTPSRVCCPSASRYLSLLSRASHAVCRRARSPPE